MYLRTKILLLLLLLSASLGGIIGFIIYDIKNTAPSLLYVNEQEIEPQATILPSSFGGVGRNEAGVFIVGGWNQKGMHSSIYRVDPCSAKVSLIKQKSPWPPRGYFPLVSLRNKMYMLGGFEFNEPSNVLGDVWATRDFLDWKMVAVDPPWERREAHGAVAHDEKLFLFGGVTYFRPDKSVQLGKDNPSHLRLFADVWTSDDGFSWKELVEKAPWGPRRNFGYASKNGFIWLWGGINDETGTLFNDVWRSRDGVTWEKVVAEAPWSPRLVNNHIGVFRDRLWLIGGGGDSEKVVGLNDVWWSRNGIDWHLVNSNADFPPRIGAYVGAERCEGKGYIFVYGGLNDDTPQGRQFFFDLWRSRNGAEWEQVEYEIAAEN